MPTTSQSLLSRRSGESPLTTPRVPGQGTTMSLTPVSAVKSLTVTFPRVYLDQRHGHSTLRGEYGELFLDTHDVDKIVKRYVRTGDSKLHLPMNKHPRQPDTYGQSSDYKALHAKEILPVRRSESLFDKEETEASHRPLQEEDEFDDDFCRSRPLITFLDSLTDEELQEHQQDYVYFEVDDENGKPVSEREGMDRDAKEVNQSQKVLKLRKLEIPLEEGVMDEVYVDDSDMTRIKVYRVENGNKLMLVRDIEVDTGGHRSGLTGEGVRPEDDSKAKHLSKTTPANTSIKERQAEMPEYMKDCKRENALSFPEHLQGNLTQEVGKMGVVPETHAVKHHKKSKHKKKSAKDCPSPTGHASDLDCTKVSSQGKELQFPQKPILPAVASPRVSGTTMVDVTSTGLTRKDLNPHCSGSTTKVPTYAGNRPLYVRTSGNEEEEELSFGLKGPGQEDAVLGENINVSETLSQPSFSELTKENSQVAPESGLSRMQQLSVEKKLKYLEPPVYFYDPPKACPLSMCFDCPGTNITHGQVRMAIMKTLENIPNAKLTSLQFMARNVILGTMWVDNRWIVSVSTKQCVTVLLGRGIEINGEPIKLRKYDDIVKEDYDKFLLNKERFSRKGGKKAMKHTIQPQTNALSLLDRTLVQDTPTDGASSEAVEVTA